MVQSPTYALARSYRCTPVVHHLDLYRLGEGPAATGAVEELGLVDLVTDAAAHALVEWPRGIDDVVAPERLVAVDIGLTGNPDMRELRMAVPLGRIVDRVELLRALSLVRA